jgi:protein-disulfide isomerase
MPTRSEQREAARAKARELRAESAKKEKRSRLVIKVTVVLVALGIVAGIGSVILLEAANRADAPEVSEVPANLTALGGLKMGVGLQAFTQTKTPTADASGDTPEIVVYVDYQCPICQAFDLPNNPQLRSWTDTGAATLEIRPISFLDRASLNEYSSRAANAAFCVANFAPDYFFDFHEALMLNQPNEGTEGPSDDELNSLATEAGAQSQEIKGCIQSKSFAEYVAQHTQRVLNEPQQGITVSGTPTVLVNGQQYTWTSGDDLVSPDNFAEFVQSVTAK